MCSVEFGSGVGAEYVGFGSGGEHLQSSDGPCPSTCIPPITYWFLVGNTEMEYGLYRDYVPLFHIKNQKA